MGNKPLWHYFIPASAGIAAAALIWPISALAAVLSLSPSSGSYSAGSTFTVRVVLDSGGGVGVNAANGTLAFDTALLNVVSVSREGSIFSLWTEEPSFSNSAGTITFGGGNPKAYTGSQGAIMSIVFSAKGGGEASVSFKSASALAADGTGRDVLSGTKGAVFTIGKAAAPQPILPPTSEPSPSVSLPSSPVGAGAVLPAPVIEAPAFPDENQWYSNKNPEFRWNLPPEATGVAMKFDKNPNTNPGLSSEGILSSKKYENVEDGIWYFHLRFLSSAGGGRVAHRKVMIDTKPPEPFSVETRMRNPYDNQPLLLFATRDSLSGVVKYEIKIGDGDLFPVSTSEIIHNPFVMPYQAPGTHPVVVRAVDAAGNFTEAKAEVLVLSPGGEVKVVSRGISTLIFLITVGSLVGALLLLAGFVFYLKKRARKERRLILANIAVLHKRISKIFGALREEVREEVRWADKREKLSEGEGRIVEKLEEAMAIAEEFISREIETIEKEIKKDDSD